MTPEPSNEYQKLVETAVRAAAAEVRRCLTGDRRSDDEIRFWVNRTENEICAALSALKLPATVTENETVGPLPHEDTIAWARLETWGEAQNICQRIKDETTFAADASEDYCKGLLSGAEACAGMIHLASRYDPKAQPSLGSLPHAGDDGANIVTPCKGSVIHSDQAAYGQRWCLRAGRYCADATVQACVRRPLPTPPAKGTQFLRHRTRAEPDLVEVLEQAADDLEWMLSELMEYRPGTYRASDTINRLRSALTRAKDSDKAS